MSDNIAQRFVGREKELDYFRKLLLSDDGGVLYVWGEGGIGKTWLLRRMAEIARKTPGVIAPVADAELIDFKLTTNHHGSGVRMAIVRCLGEDYFAEFLDEFAKFDGLRKGNYSDAVISAQRNITAEAFFKCCEELSKQGKGVLLFDTFEDIQRHDEPVARWVIDELLPRLHNFVIVIASRAEFMNGNALCSSLNKVNLRGLDAAGVSARLELDGLEIDERTRNTLLNISKGHPLWLDLILLLQDPEIIILAQKRDISADELKESLLRHFYDFATYHFGASLGQILLLMAHFEKRFGRDVLQYLVDVNLIELADRNITEVLLTLRDLPFVKFRTEDNFVLHDIMAELLVQYVWRYEDFTGDIRRELSDQILGYYAAEIDKTENEREKQGLLSERLYYQLQVDKEAAYQTFVGLFDDAIAGYSFGFCELLYSEIVEHRKQYSADRQYEIDMRWVKWLRATGENAEAKAKLEAMLAQYADDEKREVEMLTELVNARARLGEFAAAIDNLERARGICERHRLSKQLPRVYYLLGWMHRYIWQWDKALAWYGKCIEVSAEVGDDFFAAAALNDAAFIQAQRGDYKRATMDAEAALRIRKKTKDPQDDALSLNLLGTINRYAGKYDSASRYFEKAMKIFEEIKDEEWVAILRQQLGVNKYYVGRICLEEKATEEAQQLFQDGLSDLIKAIDVEERLNIRKDLPRGYHRIAHLYSAVGDESKAMAYFRKSHKLALQITDHQTALDSLVELMQLDCKDGQCDLDSYLKAAEEFRGMPQYRLFRAMMDIVQADMEYLEGSYSKALLIYREAYVQVAKDPGFGAYLLPRRLNHLQEKLHSLNAKTRMEWCNHLEQYWKQEGLEETHSEMLAMVRNEYLEAKLQQK